MGVNDALIQGSFAYLLTIVVAVCCAFIIRGIVLVLERISHKKTAALPPTPVQVAVSAQPEVEDETPKLVAAIAAAVYATMGEHRLVYIGESKGTTTWAAAGRTMHQTSHSLAKR
jgi:hypothetical protein